MQIYKSLKKLDGGNIDILVCRGRHISRAMFKQQNSNDYEIDVLAFLMCEICLVDGEKKDVDYYIDMISDDYIAIMNEINGLLVGLS